MLELMRTFAPLLAAVRKTEGRQALTVDMTVRNVWGGLVMDEDSVVTRLPQDLEADSGRRGGAHCSHGGERLRSQRTLG